MSRVKKDLKELVLARIDVMPSNRNIVIGSYGSFSKEQLKEHVEKEDEIGKKIIEIQLAFFKALKEGGIYKKIDAGNATRQ
ncbi:MAG: hypothetical protein QXT94_01895 [Methanothrix sp.]